MKRIVPLVLLLAACGQEIDYATAELEEVFRPYQIEKGEVLYKISGVEEGKEHLIFDNWGHRQRRTRDTQAGSVPIKTFRIQTPKDITSYKLSCECLEYRIKDEPGVMYYDKEKGEYVKGNPYCLKKNKVVKEVNGIKQLVCANYVWEGSKRPNALYVVLHELWDTASAETRRKLGPIIRDLSKEMALGFLYAAMIERLPIKKKIAGKDAEVYKVYGKDIRIYLWKNIILGSEVLTGKKLIVEAEKVNENPKIDETTFQIPPDFPPPVIYDTASKIFKNEKYVAQQIVDMYLREKRSE